MWLNSKNPLRNDLEGFGCCLRLIAPESLSGHLRYEGAPGLRQLWKYGPFYCFEASSSSIHVFLGKRNVGVVAGVTGLVF
jgi:hypothetical protein